jgi:hypothetical protein
MEGQIPVLRSYFAYPRLKFLLNLQFSIIFALALGWLDAAFALLKGQMTGSNGSVFQWIEFQIPILKMQVRFLPGLLKNTREVHNQVFKPHIHFLAKISTKHL